MVHHPRTRRQPAAALPKVDSAPGILAGLIHGNATTASSADAPSWSPDTTSLLTIFVVVVFVVPAVYVVGFLGSAGRPAMLLGLFAFALWLHESVLRNGRKSLGRQPVRRWLLIFLGAVALSALAGSLRPIDGIELRAVDRGMILVACVTGLALLAADGISSRRRLDVLLQRLTTVASIFAGLGIFQFFTSFDLASVLRFPGLTALAEVQGIQERSDLNRVAATASHPIEFGVVLAIILPLAIHYALYAPIERKRLAWLRVILIAAAIPLSVARSGTLAMFVAFAVMWFSWPRRLKVRSLFVAAIGTVVMRLMIPGLIGTIRSLFTNILYDPSTQGRTEDYGRVGVFIGERPYFGRGIFTFLPDRYFWLDNQYLGLLIETGIVGLIAFLGVFVVAFRTARQARIGGDPETRSLGQALAASSLAVILSAGTFDMLAFPMVSGVAFLLVGCSGALWRLTTPEREAVQLIRARRPSRGDELDREFDAFSQLSARESRAPDTIDVTRLDRSTLATVINRLPRAQPRSEPKDAVSSRDARDE
jgi:O-antigen ligase